MISVPTPSIFDRIPWRPDGSPGDHQNNLNQDTRNSFSCLFQLVAARAKEGMLHYANNTEH
eukprot:2843721-Amphidinium_carterae.1